MNRCKFLFPILALLVLLAGCQGSKSADYLAYQREGGSYNCKIEQGDTEYEAILELGEPMRLTFRSPVTLAGFSFAQSEDGIRMYLGDLEIPAVGAELPERIFGLFSLAQGDLLSASREKVSGEEITVVTFVDGAVLRLSSDGAPLMITEGDLEVNILGSEPQNID